MTSVGRASESLRLSLSLAVGAVRMWTRRQVIAAAVAAVVVAVVIGIATVLIPNPIFAREIPAVPWNYPVWIVTAALSGMLFATYVRPSPAAGSESAADADPVRDVPATSPKPATSPEPATSPDPTVDDAGARRNSRMGMAGTVLAWFAVGCPVCNKLALLALGYSGALTWFAPAQPFLAAAAILLTGVALVWRLRGQVACISVPAGR